MADNDREMLMLEARVAEAKHHQRVYQELSARWREVFAACCDAPQALPPQTVDARGTARSSLRRREDLSNRAPVRYQITTLVSAPRTIASPALQLKALAKLSMFDTGPMVRKLDGECGSVFTCSFTASSR
jgi:hypothetical protein